MPAEILHTTAIPAAIALLFLLTAWRPWQRHDRAVLRGHWGNPLAAGVAFCTAYALLDGEVPAWPPAQSRHWLFYVAAGLTGLGLLDALLPRFAHVPDWLRAEAALIASAAMTLGLFSTLLTADTWPAPAAAQWIAGMTVALHVAWVSAERLVTRLPRPAGPTIVFLFCAGVAAVMALSGSLVYARLAGVLAVVACCAALLSTFTPALTLSPGGVTVLVPTTILILFLGHHLADPGPGPLNGSLLLASLLLPWLARVPFLARRRPWLRVTVAILLALLPITAAGYRATAAFLRAQQEDATMEELYTLTSTSH